MKKLSAKRKKFCDEYLIDFNATQAAIRSGYSEKSAYSQGERLLRYDEVQEYIKNQQKEAQKQYEWTKDKAFEKLLELLDICDLSNSRERADYLKAIQELNKMSGNYEAEKHEHQVGQIVIKPYEKEEEKDDKEEND